MGYSMKGSFPLVIFISLSCSIASCGGRQKTLSVSEGAGRKAGGRATSTFSIVAFDPRDGDLGVAVSSRVLGVGSVVPWAREGVGAIATQAYANTTFGPRGLELLRQGHSPEEVLTSLLEADPDAPQRQVAIVDAQGRTAAFTGSGCFPWTGHRQGKGYSIQGNLLVSEATLTAMARTFEEEKGGLAERLLAALEAGQRAGGDARGRQSAALHVVRKRGGYGGLNDRYIQLHVEDHSEPIAELGRLLEMRLGRDALSRSANLRKRGKFLQALEGVRQASRRYPEWNDLAFEIAKLLFETGRKEEGIEALDAAIATAPHYDHYYLRAAEILATAGFPDESLAKLRQLVRLNPEYLNVIQREIRIPRSPLHAVLPKGMESLNEASGER